MAAKLYYQEDCNLSVLEGQTIAIIGYGSQGHAHALNLKESGCNVIIGLYEGSKSWAKAEAQGALAARYISHRFDVETFVVLLGFVAFIVIFMKLLYKLFK